LPLEAGTSLFFFERKGLVQKLIHQLKYQGMSEIGSFLGFWLAREMQLSKRFDSIDYVIPVALQFLLAIVTVSYQTLRAAYTNPAEILKYE
jgi:ABC-type lipoprotein release transport system permease subunit